MKTTKADESAVRAIHRRLRSAGLFVGGTWARLSKGGTRQGGGIVVTHIDITVGGARQGAGKPRPYISSRKVIDDC
jgi:hypothetical protein